MKWVFILAVVVSACTDPELPPEVTSQPQVELWGAATGAYVRSEPQLRPSERLEDGKDVFPAGVQESPQPDWVRHQITLSIWAKGDPAAVQRLMERWAAEAIKQTTVKPGATP